MKLSIMNAKASSGKGDVSTGRDMLILKPRICAQPRYVMFGGAEFLSHFVPTYTIFNTNCKRVLHRELKRCRH